MSAGSLTGAGPGGGAALPAGVRLVLAPNPGPMTLEGTNTWVLHAPGAPGAVVVDPGPDDAAHRAAVLAAVAAAGARVHLVLLTHGHVDHSGGAAALARATGAPVRAVRPVEGTAGGPALTDGQVITGRALGGLAVAVLATPGHTADSASFAVPGGLLTGDTVLGRGTSVVAAPDGALGPYLDSLHRLHALAAARDAAGAGTCVLLPGHGPAGADAAAAVQAVLAHRLRRLEQVRAAVAAGARTPAAVVGVVYPDLAPALRPAAELTARATLEHLGTEHLL